MAYENKSRRKIGFASHVGFEDLDSSEFKSGSMVFAKPGGGGGETLSTGTTESASKSLTFSKPSGDGGITLSTGTVPQDDYDDNTDDDDESGETVPAMVGIYLIYVIPFFLKLSSTIPTMYMIVALADDFGASSVIQGVVIASFQFSRAFVIGVNIYNPILSVVGGSLFGFLGFVALALYPLWQDSGAGLAIFATANCAVGLSNGFSALQIFAKQEYSHDMGSLRFALRRQSVVSGVACILSYFLGGEIYQRYGIEAIGYMGMIVMGCACIALGMYLVGRSSRFVAVTELELESPKMTSTSSIGNTVSCSTGTGDSISTANDTSVELATTKEGGGGELQAISEGGGGGGLQAISEGGGGGLQAFSEGGGGGGLQAIWMEARMMLRTRFIPVVATTATDIRFFFFASHSFFFASSSFFFASSCL